MVSLGKIKGLYNKGIDKVKETYSAWSDGQGKVIRKEALKRAAWLAYYEAFYSFNKPDVILGLLPLYTVQNIEVSRSHDILKYRAVRGEFMAHQKGGNVAVRIDFTLTGENQGYMLLILKGLQYYGSEQINYSNISMGGGGTIEPLDMLGKDANIINTTKGLQQTLDITIPEANDGSISDYKKDRREVYGDTKYYEPGDYSYLEQKIHKTFPVFLRDEVLYDMYIETLIYSRNVKEGPQNIHGTILLRHFVKPNELNNVQYRRITAPGLKGVKDGFEFKTDATTELKQEVKYRKGIQKQTGDVDFALDGDHVIFMSTLRYGASSLLTSGSGLFRSGILQSTYSTELKYQSQFTSAKTIPTPVERSVTIATGPLNLEYKSYDVTSVTEINATDIASLLPHKLYSFDTYWLVNKYNTNLYSKYGIATVESIPVSSGILNISYNNGSKECLCRITVDDYNVDINDDGTGYILRFINGNKYTLTIGNGKYAKLYFDVGSMINIYRLY